MLVLKEIRDTAVVVKARLPWDDEIGYPAVEAFKNDRIPFILDEVRLDLGKRGFSLKNWT